MLRFPPLSPYEDISVGSYLSRQGFPGLLTNRVETLRKRLKMPKGQTQVLRVQRIPVPIITRLPIALCMCFDPLKASNTALWEGQSLPAPLREHVGRLTRSSVRVSTGIPRPDSRFSNIWALHGKTSSSGQTIRQADKIALSRQPVLQPVGDTSVQKMAYQCSSRRSTKRQYVQTRETCTCGQGTHTPLPISAKPALGLAIRSRTSVKEVAVAREDAE